jgi:hypothetical protein
MRVVVVLVLCVAVVVSPAFGLGCCSDPFKVV